MNNQKDTTNTDINTEHTNINVSNNKALINNEIYTFASKKTEKLITALYMVTDCMDSDDALRVKLRSLGVEILSDVYGLLNLKAIEKHSQISSSLLHIDQILSFINIAYTIGYISEMNTAILKREFTGLISELKSYQSKDKHFTFMLDDKMFEIKKTEDKVSDPISIGQINKKTTFNNMSFISQTKRHISKIPNTVNKEERLNKIINLIKSKGEVSIKDISISFTDCSEKTIQRELNSLVSKGQIKKIGAKRWSRYQFI